MKPSIALAAVSLVPSAVAWGGVGHIATAFVASHFVSDTTQSYFQQLLRDRSDAYLAGVATWADSVKFTKWGAFSRTFHFIDAKDHPPETCNVEFERDCKETGCVVSAMANYTQQSMDATLPPWERAIAAKFVVHFIGDLHQPLHDENTEKGGNGIQVRWFGHPYNLHHVWDSSIAERWIGGGRREKPYVKAKRWADELAVKISEGQYASVKEGWLKDLDISDPVGTAMAWASECNSYICTHVLPEGAKAIEGQELSGEYYEKAGPVIELLVAQAGYRMAAWLDHIVSKLQSEGATYSGFMDVEDL